MFSKNQILLTKKKNKVTLNKSYQKGGIKIILDGYDIYNFSSKILKTFFGSESQSNIITESINKLSNLNIQGS